MLDDILREILADSEAAFRSVAVLYQDFLVRCRIHRVPGSRDLRAFNRRLAVARAGVDTTTADGPNGITRQFRSRISPRTSRASFCSSRAPPSSAAPARPTASSPAPVGSRSPGRARRLLSYMDQRGFVVTRNDRRGNRIIALPGLGWKTAPGDPNAADELSLDVATGQGDDLFNVA